MRFFLIKMMSAVDDFTKIQVTFSRVFKDRTICPFED